MQVKMLTCMAGSDFTRNPGDICDLEDAEAQRCIDAGFCEPVSGKETKVKAKKTTSTIETATKK